MTATGRYTFNTFCSVWSSGNKTVINFEAGMSFVLDSNPDILSFLLSMRGESLQYLEACFSQTRIDELLAKRIVVPVAPEASERFGRQSGFLSLCYENPGLVGANIASATVLVLGAGAIGTHVAWSLAALGVKELRIVDCDFVELSNLNRQLTFVPQDIRRRKVDVLSENLRKFNPDVSLVTYDRRINSSEDLEDLVTGVNLVIKAIDSPESVLDWVNAACVERNTPYVSSGFVDTLGLVGPVYLGNQSDCLDCFVRPDFRRQMNENPSPTCAPMTMTVASRVAVLAMKILAGERFESNMGFEVFSYRDNTFTKNYTPLVPECKTCGRKHPVSSPATSPHDWALDITFILSLTLSYLYSSAVSELAFILSWSALGCLYITTSARRQNTNLNDVSKRLATLVMFGVIVTSWLTAFTNINGLPRTPVEAKDDINSVAQYILKTGVAYCIIVVASYWGYSFCQLLSRDSLYHNLLRRNKNA